MASIVERKIRFSTAAYAIDATPKSLRNWLARGQLGFPGSEPESGWKEFDVVDIAILAITRKLVDFGLKVEEASRQARQAVLDPLFKVPHEIGQRNKDLDDAGVIEVFRGLRLIVWPDASYAFGWHVELQADASAPLPAPAVLIVSLDEVIATALRRMREHLAGTPDLASGGKA
ncbi:hypothetical protein E8E01_04745 [Methylorubrum populi]|uniref:hypothetical protein n=1 Tax=Methylorubrum populi TaxID=223967 RepID=UPI0011514A93|nr:hypothetical protein [Methylorubrum populi]QDI79785.1 hypothetical protein E8E01_04745 [Methylorubrum populi]